MSAKTTGEHVSSRRDGRAAPKNEHANHDDMSMDLLSQIQLPNNKEQTTPSLRFLAVADIDLSSASSLAEYALQHCHDFHNVDCILVNGPMVREDDVQTRYLQGRRRHKQSVPYHRSREETAALEGLASSALSQLESIVCRVVYVPHAPTDPSTLLIKSSSASASNDHEHLRLTPNSINIHERWLPLAPGIGCCGFGGIATQTQQANLHGEEHVQVQHGPEYTDALRQILALAPPSSSPSTFSQNQISIPFSSPKSQTILMTQIGAETMAAEQHNVNASNASTPNNDNAFDSLLVENNVVLNVVAGAHSSPFQKEQQAQQHGSRRLMSIAPGSLRQHGDYVLIDIGLHAQDDESHTTQQRPSYSWRVDGVEFRNMYE